MITLALCSLPLVAGGIVSLVCLMSAPEGYENETGFHFGNASGKTVTADSNYPVGATIQAN